MVQQQMQALIATQNSMLAESMIQPYIQDIKRCSGENPTEYRTWRRAISRLQHEVTAAQLMKIIRRTLVTPALEVFLTIYHDDGQAQTWANVQQVLDEQFQSPETRYQAQMNFAEKSNRKAKEHIVAYKNRLVSMAQLAYDDIHAPQMQRDMVHLFCRGLKNPDTALHLLTERPADLEQAVRWAMRHDACLDMVKKNQATVAFPNEEELEETPKTAKKSETK